MLAGLLPVLVDRRKDRLTAGCRTGTSSRWMSTARAAGYGVGLARGLGRVAPRETGYFAHADPTGRTRTRNSSCYPRRRRAIYCPWELKMAACHETSHTDGVDEEQASPPPLLPGRSEHVDLGSNFQTIKTATNKHGPGTKLKEISAGESPFCTTALEDSFNIFSTGLKPSTSLTLMKSRWQSGKP